MTLRKKPPGGSGAVQSRQGWFVVETAARPVGHARGAEALSQVEKPVAGGAHARHPAGAPTTTAATSPTATNPSPSPTASPSRRSCATPLRTARRRRRRRLMFANGRSAPPDTALAPAAPAAAVG